MKRPTAATLALAVVLAASIPAVAHAGTFSVLAPASMPGSFADCLVQQAGISPDRIVEAAT